MKKIFIGSSLEAQKKAETVGAILKKLGAEITLWTDPGALAPSEQTLASLIQSCQLHDGAVFLFNTDDCVWRNKDSTKKTLSTRDNVSVETGLFSGMLGQTNVALCIVKGVTVPSDLYGLNRISYNANNLNRMTEEFRCWLNKVEEIDRENQLRFPRNVHIGRKDKVEGRASIYDRLKGVRELTLVNFAATAFITGALVDKKYENDDNDGPHRWLMEHLTSQCLNVNMILTEPGSFADTDASRYKMYPNNVPSKIVQHFFLSTQDSGVSERERYHFIIRENFNRICDVKLRKKLDNIRIYHTDTVLPVGIMHSKFPEGHADQLQVNLYLPCIDDDKMRPTFVLREDDPNTMDLYGIFINMMDNLRRQATKEFSGHPDVGFLFGKPIIHRAMLHQEFEEMSRDAVRHCAEENHPVEVDLLYLPAAGEILVARDKDVDIVDSKGTTKKQKLSTLTKSQLKKHMKERYDGGEASQLLTLQDLLQMVQEIAAKKHSAPIPLLLELKDQWTALRADVRDHVIRVCRIMKAYEQETKGNGRYALHAANPFVIRCVKDFDVRIPCGWICVDFEAHKDIYPDVNEEFKRIQSEAKGIGGQIEPEKGADAQNQENEYYPIPDFISCKIGDFSAEWSDLRKACKEYNLKRLGWVAKDQDTYQRARTEEQYDNVLVEEFFS